MAKDLRFESMPLAEEFDVGDDSDMPGFDQPYTSDDIDAVLNSPTASIEERRSLLNRILDDLQAREVMDEAREFSDLIAQVQGALSTLDEPADGIGTPGAYAFDPDDRAMSPDEILERDEEQRNKD